MQLPILALVFTLHTVHAAQHGAPIIQRALKDIQPPSQLASRESSYDPRHTPMHYAMQQYQRTLTESRGDHVPAFDAPFLNTPPVLDQDTTQHTGGAAGQPKAYTGSRWDKRRGPHDSS